MVGMLFYMLIGLSIKISWTLSKHIQIEYKLEGVMLMKMICLCFMVGNSACGVFSQL